MLGYDLLDSLNHALHTKPIYDDFVPLVRVPSSGPVGPPAPKKTGPRRGLATDVARPTVPLPSYFNVAIII